MNKQFTTMGSTNSRQKRSTPRTIVHRPAILHYDGTSIPVILKDISTGGTRIDLPRGRDALAPDVKAQVDIPGLMRLPVDVKWRNSTTIGVAFDLPQHRKAMFGAQIKRMLGPKGR